MTISGKFVAAGPFFALAAPRHPAAAPTYAAMYHPDAGDGGGAGAGAGAGAGGGGSAAGVGGTASFADSLPESIRTDAAFASIKNLDDLAKGYHGFSKKFGVPAERLVTLPEKPDDAEGWSGVYKALGRPDSADKYDLRDPAPETGIKVDAELKKWFGEKAHAYGLSNQQAAKLYDDWNALAGERGKASAAALTAQATEATAALKKEWGDAFPVKLQLAEQALNHYGGEDVAKFLTEKGLQNDPRIVRMFAKMGDQLAEDGVIGRAPGGDSAVSPTEAKQQIAALETSAEWRDTMKLGPNNPAYKAMLERRGKLYQMAYPETDKA